MKIEWIDRDFNDMVYNPWKIPFNTHLKKVYPVLGLYPELDPKMKKLAVNKVLRYVMYMYDKGSPLITKIDGIYKQKIEAATLAGFKMRPSGTFDEEVNEMMVGYNHQVNHMIVRYLRLMRDEEFMQFRIYKEKLYTSLQKMQEIDDPKILASIISVNKSLTAVIDQIKVDFFRPGDAKQLIEVLYEQAEFEDLELTPEHITDRIQQGLAPVDYFPYGEVYKFDRYSEEDTGEEGKSTLSIPGSG